MNIQKPKNFNDILELQDILDNNINNIRERTLRDIKLSLIAEVIEFNEETQYSHKTWKSKEYSKEKELEELTDIYFFFAQLLNYKKLDGRFPLSYYLKTFEKFFLYNENPNIIGLIRYIADESYLTFFKALITLTREIEYTKDDILKCYWKKWQKNMTRIGKEWN